MTKLEKAIKVKMEDILAIDDIYARMPYKTEKWVPYIDKGKDSFDIAQAMEKGMYISD
jgi:hypothetical protein